MKDLRAMGTSVVGWWLWWRWGRARVGGSPAAKPDTGVQDAPVDQQQRTDVPLGTDARPAAGSRCRVAEDAADGPVDAGSGIDCAPGADGWPEPAGTAPQQAAGPTVATSATRPELSAAVATGNTRSSKALARATDNQRRDTP